MGPHGACFAELHGGVLFAWGMQGSELHACCMQRRTCKAAALTLPCFASTWRPTSRQRLSVSRIKPSRSITRACRWFGERRGKGVLGVGGGGGRGCWGEQGRCSLQAIALGVKAIGAHLDRRRGTRCHPVAEVALNGPATGGGREARRLSRRVAKRRRDRPHAQTANVRCAVACVACLLTTLTRC